MQVLCLWCRQQAEQGSPDERTPLGDEPVTYGICPSHRLEFLVLHYLGRREPAGQ